MAKKSFEERYPGMSIEEVVAIQQSHETESFFESIKSDIKEENERYDYLSRLETKGLEGCENCLVSVNVALDEGDALGEEETLRAIKVAREQMAISKDAQLMKESISKERSERLSVIGMGIAAGATILTDLGLKGKLTPITKGAKSAGKKIFDVFKKK